jgi:hypothetical protein
MNIIKSTLFVYFKDNKIKALCLDDSLKHDKELIKNGWLHTATLCPTIFIENLFNNDVDIVSEIKSLNKPWNTPENSLLIHTQD